MPEMKCKICGAQLHLTLEDHYIVRDPGKAGALATLSSYNEPELYDACDCPVCGCQHVYQERKRIANLIDIGVDKEAMAEDEPVEGNEETEKDPDAWIIQDTSTRMTTQRRPMVRLRISPTPLMVVMP